ncbi:MULTISPECIES: ribonuclease III [Acetobacteraceae]|uniref:Ribonuclease 3 n=1 Tax=Bombella apis TaxID=1785988 RepID=A0ABR9MMT4_9PROT|nr:MULTISPECIES: ribonuclease III [Acetobacteraceae]MUG79155.1 ribonuclease III [Bombella sp. ESL0380]MUH02472.1 ribonuclease III [Bombella sp. ESL0387]MBE1722973.1 ribonuclease III [Bombella apis]MBR9730780.1 ribonuclease III [Bombella apis]MCL1513075.1 ribonuclease III [Parasaccharibacter sp. TMW 2.1891]
MMTRDEAVRHVEAKLEHRFADPALLHEALTHRSAVPRRQGRNRGRQKGHAPGKTPRGQGSNERLEFVGDRVLGLLMAEWLFERYPEEQEGALGARHAHLVSRPVLARIAEGIELSEAIQIAQHEESAGIRVLASVLADAMEALLGALYLDAGLDPARHVVRRLWDRDIEKSGQPHKEPKTLLQEFLLGRGEALPHYELTAADGPSHAPIFRVEVRALGQVGVGRAGSKRLAESAAATDLLKKMGQETERA